MAKSQTGLSESQRVAPCRPRLKPSAFALAFALALAGCTKAAPDLCQGLAPCAPGFSCDPATGACACDADSACAAAESCNSAGFCQPRLRCESSADCASGSFCDSPTGVCIPQDTCTLDVQCNQSQVCEDFTCVAGCRTSGDCLLSEVCRACPPGTNVADCPVGQACVSGPCDSQLSCQYGELCAPPANDPAGDKVCQKDLRGPYCQSCANVAGTQNYCLDGAQNFCLIDLSKDNSYYCGVDCSSGQACPNGYQCKDIRIVTAQQCAPADGLSACTGRNPSAPLCDPAKNHAGPKGGVVNDDCEAIRPPLVGAVCDPKTSRCVAQCLTSGETSTHGYCSCTQDADCPQDVCEAGTRRCAISGKPCFLGAVPDDCQSTQSIFCVKALDARLGEVGYCRIGQNCAPGPGFTCTILRGN